MSDVDRGVWLGALLLMLALIVGLTCGYVLGLRVERVSHRREVKAVAAQRDAAQRDAMVWFTALKGLIEGAGTETIQIGRVAEED